MPEYPAVGEPVPADEIDVTEQPVTQWVPTWTVDCGKECEVGILIDDHCFVVVAKNWADQWMPLTHIPREAAKKIGELIHHV